MNTVCNVCDGTEFVVNAGFYYCDNCGTQAAVLQEVEDQTDGQFDDVRKKSHKIKQIAPAQGNELTTWEAYNYILYGFVNELIQLGCKDELISITLQLWAAYLRKNEVAFFGKKETHLPKFSFKYNQRDVRLIYSLPAKKRRTSSAAASSSEAGDNITIRQSKIALRKKRRSLATAQYEEYMSSQRTDISSVGLNLSQRSSTGQSTDNSDTTIRIRYSRRTKRKVHHKMTREHLIEHQNDFGRKLKCHDYKDKEVLGRSFVYAMLWLALNQIGDSVQISDLIRYANESHIKLNNISSFLPPNIDAKVAVNHFRKGSNDAITHVWLRTKALTIARIIGIRNVEQPDLVMLCERYCNDLCLPLPISDMVKRLIAFHPPQMKMSETAALSRTVPNYEGRAMAYILFILKLLFGLDDKRENEISISAQMINNQSNESDSKCNELFVWSEWMEYIEMRNTILSQCHFPTAIQIDPNTNMHTEMYIDFLRRNNEDSPYQEAYRKVEMDNIRLIFNQIVQLHEQNDRHNVKPSYNFEPSLTPFRSYMEQIASDRSIKSKIYMPTYMNVEHDKRDIIPYVKPNKMKQMFRTMNLRLKIKEVAFNNSLQFDYVRHGNGKISENVRFMFDVTTAEWIDSMKERDKHRSEQLQKDRVEHNEKAERFVREHLLNQRIKQTAYALRRKHDKLMNITNLSSSNHVENPSNASTSYQYFDEQEKDICDDNLLKEPRRDLDKQPNMLNYDELSDNDDDDDDDVDDDDDHERVPPIEFVISNSDYWIAMQNIYYMTNATFVDSVNALPKSFQWLLKQCALQIHMHIKDLYIELLAIENQYRYVLKPIFKMDNYIKFRSSPSEKLDTEMQNCIRNLKRIW